MNAQPGRILYPHIMTCSTAPVLTKAKWTVDTSLFTGDNLRDTVADAVELARRFGLPPDVSPASFRLELLDFIERKTSCKLRNRLRVATFEKLSFIYTNNGDTKPTSMPLYKTPTRPNDSDFDSESDDDKSGRMTSPCSTSTTPHSSTFWMRS
ncbi:hypothetical protein GQ600_11402 [Phytophthora cactorum]|nr:hypothetical protein GQ600_11402 [Phytophthora cactorum]